MSRWAQTRPHTRGAVCRRRAWHGWRSLLTAALVLSATESWSPAVSALPPLARQEPELPERLTPPPPPETAEAFLAEVELLISPAERQAFNKLEQPYQRALFMRRFWAVRDPYPQTPHNELEERFRIQLAQARDRFPEADDERQQVWTLLGEPSREQRGTCSDWLEPMLIWRFESRHGISGALTVVLYQPQGRSRGRYRTFDPNDGLREVISWAASAGMSDSQVAQAVIANCTMGQEVLSALSQAISLDRLRAVPALVPQVSGEWVRSFVAYGTDLPEGAKPLSARLELGFPGRHQSRTVVQGVIQVPANEATPAAALAAGTTGGYVFAVDGEILREGELFEQFRYRFGVPPLHATVDPSRVAQGEDVATALIPLVFERRLRPGTYRLILRVEDTVGEKFFRVERDLEVPAFDPSLTATAAPTPVEPPIPTSPGGELPLGSQLAEANAARDSGDWTLELAAPRAELAIGKVRVEAFITGEGIAEVAFSLNGRAVFTKRRAPFSVELDLGDKPRLHTVAATAKSAEGRVLASDEVLLNGGAQRFAVRLLSPERGKSYNTSLRAHAEVELPGGEELDRVEIFVNELLVATLYQPPFVQPVVLPTDAEITYVRALAHLGSGGTAEDLVFVNAPQYLDEVDVQLVELYTTFVDRRGRPIDDLRREEVVVREDGKPQTIERFEKVVDRPIHAGLLLDTSTSMLEELAEVEKAALGFLRDVLRPQDRAALITFADTPRLAVRFTNDLEVLAGGLAGLLAEGQTALYDSAIFSLHYLGGLSGKRSLVLLTDGEDVSSRYSFDDVVEYARRLGIAVYPIGMDVAFREAKSRTYLQKLATETGGRAFFIRQAGELEGVYDEIEAELRSQLVITYQSAQPTEADRDRFREVAVEVSRPGIEARTMRGYYP